MSATPLHAAEQTLDDTLIIDVSLQVLGYSSLYAAALSVIERRFPVKPDHIWAEVAGGVLISLVPVALRSRKQPTIHWRTYELAVWTSFMASGVPIILWQLGEAILRQRELLRYTASRDRRSGGSYGNHTTSLADRGGPGARADAASGERVGAELTASPADA